MNRGLLQLLLCPSCDSTLLLTSFKSFPQSEVSGGGDEIISGALRCKCGITYPIIEGVPRFLKKGLRSFPDFVETYQEQLEKLDGSQISHVPSEGNNSSDDYDCIRKSFSQEWELFDYETDKTWGWTLAERKKIFLGDFNLQPEELSGKSLLDAGCGNGTLTAAVSTFGLDVIGIDLNDGLGRAYGNRGKFTSKSDHVQYVQGNLANPPLKPQCFDLIYSSGVIHHTPSSANTFASLARLIKQGGRMYVWVYGKRSSAVCIFFRVGRSLKRWMSLKSVLRICRMIAPFYKLTTALLNVFGIAKFRSRTVREITLDLFDGFAPQYNHAHSEDEVRSWFERHGFENIHVSGIQKHGFGMYGDKV